MHMCCLASNPWHYCQKWNYRVIFTSHALHCTALTAVKLLCIKVVRLFIARLHAVQTSALHVRWGLSSNKNISQMLSNLTQFHSFHQYTFFHHHQFFEDLWTVQCTLSFFFCYYRMNVIMVYLASYRNINSNVSPPAALDKCQICTIVL